MILATVSSFIAIVATIAYAARTIQFREADARLTEIVRQRNMAGDEYTAEKLRVDKAEDRVAHLAQLLKHERSETLKGHRTHSARITTN